MAAGARARPTFAVLPKSACFILLAAVVVGCATPPLARDEYYPVDWSDIVSAGEDCRGLEGAFENKGVLVDEHGQRKDVWLTDLFGKHFAKKEVIEAREALRRFERVTLKLELGVKRQLMPPDPGDKPWILVIEPSRPITAEPGDRAESYPSLRPTNSRRALGLGDGGVCTNGNLHGHISEMLEHGGHSNCVLALGSDGSLIVQCQSVFVGLVIVIPVYLSEYWWARFSKMQ